MAAAAADAAGEAGSTPSLTLISFGEPDGAPRKNLKVVSVDDGKGHRRVLGFDAPISGSEMVTPTKISARIEFAGRAYRVVFATSFSAKYSSITLDDKRFEYPFDVIPDETQGSYASCAGIIATVPAAFASKAASLFAADAPELPMEQQYMLDETGREPSQMDLKTYTAFKGARSMGARMQLAWLLEEMKALKLRETEAGCAYSETVIKDLDKLKLGDQDLWKRVVKARNTVVAFYMSNRHQQSALRAKKMKDQLNRVTDGKADTASLATVRTAQRKVDNTTLSGGNRELFQKTAASGEICELKEWKLSAVQVEMAMHRDQYYRVCDPKGCKSAKLPDGALAEVKTALDAYAVEKGKAACKAKYHYSAEDGETLDDPEKVQKVKHKAVLFFNDKWAIYPSLKELQSDAKLQLHIPKRIEKRLKHPEVYVPMEQHAKALERVDRHFYFPHKLSNQLLEYTRTDAQNAKIDAKLKEPTEEDWKASFAGGGDNEDDAVAQKMQEDEDKQHAEDDAVENAKPKKKKPGPKPKPKEKPRIPTNYAERLIAMKAWMEKARKQREAAIAKHGQRGQLHSTQGYVLLLDDGRMEVFKTLKDMEDKWYAANPLRVAAAAAGDDIDMAATASKDPATAAAAAAPMKDDEAPKKKKKPKKPVAKAKDKKKARRKRNALVEDSDDTDRDDDDDEDVIDYEDEVNINDVLKHIKVVDSVVRTRLTGEIKDFMQSREFAVDPETAVDLLEEKSCGSDQLLLKAMQYILKILSGELDDGNDIDVMSEDDGRGPPLKKFNPADVDYADLLKSLPADRARRIQMELTFLTEDDEFIDDPVAKRDQIKENKETDVLVRALIEDIVEKYYIEPNREFWPKEEQPTAADMSAARGAAAASSSSSSITIASTAVTASNTSSGNDVSRKRKSPEPAVAAPAAAAAAGSGVQHQQHQSAIDLTSDDTKAKRARSDPPTAAPAPAVPTESYDPVDSSSVNAQWFAAHVRDAKQLVYWFAAYRRPVPHLRRILMPQNHYELVCMEQKLPKSALLLYGDFKYGVVDCESGTGYVAKTPEEAVTQWEGANISCIDVFRTRHVLQYGKRGVSARELYLIDCERLIERMFHFPKADDTASTERREFVSSTPKGMNLRQEVKDEQTRMAKKVEESKGALKHGASPRMDAARAVTRTWIGARLKDFHLRPEIVAAAIESVEWAQTVDTKTFGWVEAERLYNSFYDTHEAVRKRVKECGSAEHAARFRYGFDRWPSAWHMYTATKKQQEAESNATEPGSSDGKAEEEAVTDPKELEWREKFIREQLRSLTECVICSLFDRPFHMLFKCGHDLCLECVKGLNKTDKDEYVCPMCRCTDKKLITHTLKEALVRRLYGRPEPRKPTATRLREHEEEVAAETLMEQARAFVQEHVQQFKRAMGRSNNTAVPLGTLPRGVVNRVLNESRFPSLELDLYQPRPSVECKLRIRSASSVSVPPPAAGAGAGAGFQK